MLIYEKDNKLNINFDNEVSENPDLQISKENDKTSVAVDGQPIGSSGGDALIVNITDKTLEHPNSDVYLICDKTAKEMADAMQNGIVYGRITTDESVETSMFSSSVNESGAWTFKLNIGRIVEQDQVGLNFLTSSEDEYPIYAKLK